MVAPIIEQALREFFEAQPAEIIAADLFGSVARGTAGARSDVDVGVLYGTVPPDPRGPLDLTAAEAAIRRCEWFYFDATSAWFYGDSSDLGVAALRPDRASLALVAGTATD